MRHNKFVNIQGHRVEYASELIVPYERFTPRESRSQKSQINSQHRPTTTPGRKRPIKDKLN